MKPRIRDRIYEFIHDDIFFILINYFVAYIPFWTIRKWLYKLFGIKIGKNSRIAMKCVILGPKGIEIGDRNVINEFVLMDGRSGLKIGNDNSISMYAKIYSGTHITDSATFEYKGLKTVLEDNCWIGTSAIILPGSIVKDFSVISANSLYKGVTEEKGIYQGVPATFVRTRNLEEKYNLHYKSYFR